MKKFLVFTLIINLFLPSFVFASSTDVIYEAQVIPNDTEVFSQDYLETINVYDAWEINKSADDVVIAVIDSGVDIDHPDLRDNIWTNPNEILNGLDDDGNGYVDDIYGWDFVKNTSDPRPKYDSGTPENSIGVQHGTGVAGLIAATGDNSEGISGVTWSAQIMSLRVLNQYGSGNSQTVTKALRYAIEQKVDIINMSLVGTDYDPEVVSLLNTAYEEGIIVVAAAGNVGIDLNSSETYPVCYNDFGKATVIGVGAIDNNYSKPSFSNFGNDCVDIVAPGVEMFTTRHVGSGFSSQSYYAALFSGTSFATPLVTGTVALIKQMVPHATAEDILFLLQEGSTRIDDFHAANAGFDYALNVAGTLTLAQEFDFVDTTKEISEEEIEIVLPNPRFIVYPLNNNIGNAYRYEFPGPVFVLPAVFDEESLKQGMRWSKEHDASYLVNAWKEGSKQLWKFNPFTNDLSLYMQLGFDNLQTIGNVAVGNVDFDIQKEIIVVSGPNSDPYITIFNQQGSVKYQFKAYEDNIRGGLDVDLIDINGDGIMEIVTVPETQGNGHIKFFEYTGLQLREWSVYQSGVNVGATISTADVNNDGVEDILVGPGPSGGPDVRVLDVNGQLVQNFFAGDDIGKAGADVQYGDIDQDGISEFVVTYKEGQLPLVRLYNSVGEFQRELGVFDLKYDLGVGLIIL